MLRILDERQDVRYALMTGIDNSLYPELCLMIFLLAKAGISTYAVPPAKALPFIHISIGMVLDGILSVN